MIQERQGDLFNVMTLDEYDENTVLLHACNCMGVWGSGIAVEFRRRFPDAEREYRQICQKNTVHSLKLDVYGKGIVLTGNVGCLFTSRSYGKDKDDIASIVSATYDAVLDMDSRLDRKVKVHSPKINAGLFGVPWQETKDVLDKALAQAKNIEEWMVWSLKPDFAVSSTKD